MSWTMTGRVKHTYCGVNGETITTTQKLVLMLLAESHNEDTGYAWPKLKNLAKCALLDDRSVQRALAHLISCGLLTVEKGVGRGNTSKYFVLPKGDTGTTLSEKVTSEVKEKVTLEVENENVSINEPIEGKKEEPIELPIPKPKRETKVKDFKKRAILRPRSLNDFPDSAPTEPVVPRVEIHEVHVGSGSPVVAKAEYQAKELWKEMRAMFKRAVGKSMGNLFGRPAELFCESFEKYGADEMLAGFREFLEHEKPEYLKKAKNCFGFLYEIDQWISDSRVQEEGPESEKKDINAGLGLSEAGRKKLERYANAS